MLVLVYLNIFKSILYVYIELNNDEYKIMMYICVVVVL